MDHTVLPANYTMPAFCFASVHQMVPLPREVKASDGGLLLTYRPRRDERLSWPGWLIYSGWLTHISGYPSATGRAQDSEVRRRKDRRSTVIPRNQPTICTLTPNYVGVLVPPVPCDSRPFVNLHPEPFQYRFALNTSVNSNLIKYVTVAPRGKSQQPGFRFRRIGLRELSS